MIKAFLNLEIWKRARALVKTIYLATNSFPHEETFALTIQLRRSAISVPSNIAEGCGKGTHRDLGRYLDIAMGSLCELETQIYLSFDLEYITEETLEQIVDEITQIRKMTLSFQKKLKR